MKSMALVAISMVSALCAPQPSPTFTDVRVKFVINSFDNEEIETTIPFSMLESILQSVDSEPDGTVSIGEIECDNCY